MARQNTQQLNVRSAFARQRAHDIARRTGMTVTQVVEDALRGYTPPVEAEAEVRPAPPEGLVWEGPLLVKPATPGARRITNEEVLAAIEADRGERSDDILNAGT